MKNKLIYLLMAVLTLTACDLKEDHKFDRSPDERLMEMLGEYNDALTSSPNGWFLALDSNAGGFLFYMSFNDKGRVTMLSDLEATRPSAGSVATTPKESSYIVRALQMPSLLFDTYNYLHIICDPQGANNGGSNGTGLGTDFEFDILRYDGGVFYLRGSYNHQYGYLYPATAAEAEAVMNGGLKEIHSKLSSYMGAMDCAVIGNDDEKAQVSINGRTVEATYFNGSAYESVSTSCYMDMSAVTENKTVSDIKFFEPLTLFGKTITGLRWNGEEYETVMEGNSEVITVFDNLVPPFPLDLGINKSYDVMTFTTYSAFEGTMSQKYYDDYYYKTWYKLYNRSTVAANRRYLNKVVYTFTKDATGVPCLQASMTINNEAATSNYAATVNLYYTENEDGTITFGRRDHNNGNAKTYSILLRDMFDVFNTITYSSQTASSSNYAEVIAKEEPHTFRIDWVPNNTPGLTGMIGGLYRVDDPELYVCGILSRK